MHSFWPQHCIYLEEKLWQLLRSSWSIAIQSASLPLPKQASLDCDTDDFWLLSLHGGMRTRIRTPEGGGGGGGWIRGTHPPRTVRNARMRTLYRLFILYASQLCSLCAVRRQEAHPVAAMFTYTYKPKHQQIQTHTHN